AVAIEELHPEPAFQTRQHPGQRRLRDMKLFGRRRHVLQLGKCEEPLVIAIGHDRHLFLCRKCIIICPIIHFRFDGPTRSIVAMPQLAPGPTAHRAGSGGYRRVTAALCGAGLASFAAMYCTQALLPALSAYYRISPAISALTVSLTTGMLALSIVPASVL